MMVNVILWFYWVLRWWSTWTWFARKVHSCFIEFCFVHVRFWYLPILKNWGHSVSWLVCAKLYLFERKNVHFANWYRLHWQGPGIANRNKLAPTNKKWAFGNVYKYLRGMQDIYIQCGPPHELLNVLLQKLMGWS